METESPKMDFKERFLEQTCSWEGAELWGLRTLKKVILNCAFTCFSYMFSHCSHCLVSVLILETRRDTHIGLQLIEFLEEAFVSTMIIKDVVQKISSPVSRIISLFLFFSPFFWEVLMGKLRKSCLKLTMSNDRSLISKVFECQWEFQHYNKNN